MDKSGPITTATSAGEGRLVVGAGCTHGKKKCLKCAIKKDGKGGIGFSTGLGGFGATGAQNGAVLSITDKPHAFPSTVGGKKISGVKASSSLRALNKKMKLGKTLVSLKAPRGLKIRSSFKTLKSKVKF